MCYEHNENVNNDVTIKYGENEPEHIDDNSDVNGPNNNYEKQHEVKNMSPSLVILIFSIIGGTAIILAIGIVIFYIIVKKKEKNEKKKEFSIN